MYDFGSYQAVVDAIKYSIATTKLYGVFGVSIYNWLLFLIVYAFGEFTIGRLLQAMNISHGFADDPGEMGFANMDEMTDYADFMQGEDWS